MDDMLLLPGKEFEYPLILEMWPASLPPSEHLKQQLASLDASALDAVLKEPLKDDPQGLTLHPAAQKAAIERLTALKEAVQQATDLPLREIAFRVIPEWRQAWQAAADSGHVGPIRRICLDLGLDVPAHAHDA